MLPEDAILLPEIVDEIFLVAIHPASQSQHEEVQSVGHGRRLHGSDTAVTHVVSGIHSPRPFSRTIRATDTTRPAIVAHVATGRADAAEHTHAPGLAAGCAELFAGPTRPERDMLRRDPVV